MAAALVQRGFAVRPVVWDDPAVDWAAFRLGVIRSTWDYQHRHAAFLAWADRAGALTDLWNPPTLLRWNSHKGYLRDLAAQGVRVVPTHWLAAGTRADLAGLLRAAGWARAVVKPAVSASAFGTVLVTEPGAAASQAHLDSLLATRDIMVQPFLESVGGYGERSLLFADGAFTHAVRRPPMLGEAHDAAAHPVVVTPTPEELALATTILRLLPVRPLYARVDLVPDATGAPCLMELELIEPSLFLDYAPEAAEQYAAAVAARCHR